MDNTLDSTQVSTNSSLSFRSISSASSVASFGSSYLSESFGELSLEYNSQPLASQHAFIRPDRYAYNCYQPVGQATVTGQAPAYDTKKILNHHMSRQTVVAQPSASIEGDQAVHRLASYPSQNNVLGSLSHNYNKTTLYQARGHHIGNAGSARKSVKSAETLPKVKSNIQRQTSSSMLAHPAHTVNVRSKANHTHHTHESTLDHQRHKQQVSTTPTPKASAPVVVKAKSSWRSGWKNAIRKQPSIARALDAAPEELRTQPATRPVISSPIAVQPEQVWYERQQPAPRPSSAIRPVSSRASAHNRLPQLPRRQEYADHRVAEVERKETMAAAAPAAHATLLDLCKSSESRHNLFESVQLQFLDYCATTKSRQELNYAKSITASQTVLSMWEKRWHTNSSSISSTRGLVRLGFRPIEAALKQLRDAIAAESLEDELSLQVFVYSVQAGALESCHTTYVPSVQYILTNFYPEDLLSTAQFTSILCVHVLHLTHFGTEVGGSIVEAFDALNTYSSMAMEGIGRLWDIVRVLVDHDFLQWRRLYEEEADCGWRGVMRLGEGVIAREALSHLRRGGQGVKQKDMENMLGVEWERIVGELECGWRRDDDDLIVIE